MLLGEREDGELRDLRLLGWAERPLRRLRGSEIEELAEGALELLLRDDDGWEFALRVPPVHPVEAQPRFETPDGRVRVDWEDRP